MKTFGFLTTSKKRYAIHENADRITESARSWWGNQRERGHWGDLGIDGWIILGWISRRWDVGMWTGLDWPRIETGGGLL